MSNQFRKFDRMTNSEADLFRWSETRDKAQHSNKHNKQCQWI